mmetsp:Transcript_16912/g.56782  ORF Transcript_16912/g.56782 Transcript_16912/m.56782 type:complete len:80 (-) Transcript_16912:88-327(-)
MALAGMGERGGLGAVAIRNALRAREPWAGHQRTHDSNDQRQDPTSSIALTSSDQRPEARRRPGADERFSQGEAHPEALS